MQCDKALEALRADKKKKKGGGDSRRSTTVEHLVRLDMTTPFVNADVQTLLGDAFCPNPTLQGVDDSDRPLPAVAKW